jgi:hypothetical protein
MKSSVARALLLTGAALTTLLVPASASAQSPRARHIMVSVKTVQSFTTFLGAVSCVPDGCVAVGSSGQGGVGVQILDGDPGKAFYGSGGSGMAGVACTGVEACWAVGHTLSGAGEVVPVVDGQFDSDSATYLHVVPSGVSCPTSSWCVVVGADFYLTITNDAVGRPVSVPESLSAVACYSQSSCVAVGDADVVPIDNGTAGPVRSVPGAQLSGVTCPSQTQCLAVGSSANEGVVVPIANQVPGRAEPVSNLSALFSVACPTATTCLASGTNAAGTKGAAVPVVHNVPGRARTINTFLPGVTCGSSSSCTAVGTTSDPEEYGVVVNLTD